MSEETWILRRGEWQARISRLDLSVYTDHDGGWRWTAEGRGISTGKAATREEAMAAAEVFARGPR